MRRLGGCIAVVVGVAALALSVDPAGAAPTSTTTTTTMPSTTTTTVPTMGDIADAAAGQNTAVRLTPPLRTATIIGDSAIAGIRWNGALSGFTGFIVDHRLESCRRLVYNSCNGREGYVPPTAFQEIQSLPVPAATDVLVIATGYNDSHFSFDTHSTLILDAAVAKGYQTIAWVTYRVDVDYELPIGDVDTSNYSLMNNRLDELVASGTYPALQIWDLNTYASATVGWFWSDGVHEQRLGSFGVADWISRHMAALDARPCPRPWSIEFGQEQQCPDPDRLPFVRGYPALTQLYDV